jgi:hypothetical protein
MLKIISLIAIAILEKPLIEMLVEAVSRSADSHRHSFL